MNSQRILVGFALTLIIFLSTYLPDNVAQAQNVNCQQNYTATLTSTARNYSNAQNSVNDTHCYTVTYDGSFEFDLHVTSGSVGLWISEEGSATFTNYGTYPNGALSELSLLLQTSATNPTRVALAASNNASFNLAFTLSTQSPNTVQADVAITVPTYTCASLGLSFDDCGGANPAGLVALSLASQGDFIAIPVRPCEGEMKVTVTGMIGRDVAIHYLPVGVPPPNQNTSQAYRPNWNPETFIMYSFRTFTASDLARPWFVYIVRTGNPVINGQAQPVNFNVGIYENCGQYPLSFAAAPRQAGITAPKSGDNQQGGVSVEHYCRARHLYYIPRTVSDQFWVCYDPEMDQVVFTVEQSDFNAMCVNHYGAGAYMVKQPNQATGGNCYR